MRKEIKAIKNAYTTLHCEIEHVDDLKKYGLTLVSYHSACDIMDDLRKPGSSAETIQKDVASFFRSFGFTVKEKGIGYQISI